MASNFIFNRSIFVGIFTFILLQFTPSHSLLSSIILGLFGLIFSLLVSNIFKTSIANVLSDRNNSNLKNYKNKASSKDVFLYIIDYNLVMCFPFCMALFAMKYKEYSNYIYNLLNSNIFWLVGFIISFLYFSILLFTYRKRTYLFYTLFWISVPIAGALNYFNEIFGISGILKRTLIVYAIVMGLFLTMVAAWDYLDKKIQESNSKLKPYWNDLLDFISWDFLNKHEK